MQQTELLDFILPGPCIQKNAYSSYAKLNYKTKHTSDAKQTTA